jgi:hypothetical protein
MLRGLCDDLGQQLEQQVTEDQLWLGRRVKIIDGTSVSMPDTVANQKLWPQSSAQKPGCGFPLLKLLGVFSLQSGALLDLTIANQRQHDALLARQLWNQFQAGDIALADRGFCSFGDLVQLQSAGIDAVMRLHQARKTDFRRGKRLGPNDRLVVWTKPAPSTSRWTKEQLKTLPDAIQLRLVRYRIDISGCRCQEVILVTTLLDAHRFSAAQLAELYFRRWGVELHFRQIKIFLGMDVLRCLSPAMVRKELLMHLVAYNLIRALMHAPASSIISPLDASPLRVLSTVFITSLTLFTPLAPSRFVSASYSTRSYLPLLQIRYHLVPIAVNPEQRKGAPKTITS